MLVLLVGQSPVLPSISFFTFRSSVAITCSLKSFLVVPTSQYLIIYITIACLTPPEGSKLLKDIDRVVLFMAVALMAMLFVKMPDIPEVWEGVGEA